MQIKMAAAETAAAGTVRVREREWTVINEVSALLVNLLRALRFVSCFR